jgi:hypothetical protein
LFVLFVALLAMNAPAEQAASGSGRPDGKQALVDTIEAQPQLVRIEATVDGSGRFVFTRAKVCYEHKHWDAPTNVRFDGVAWTNFDATPAPWTDYCSRLDLTKAWIVKRQGRDTIALEQTPDGFDLYVSDSPKGVADYEVTIAIPRRP